MTVIAYVAGLGFSGSTLLSFLVARHPALVSVGELTGPQPEASADYACSCAEPVRGCPFWREIAARMERRGVRFDPLAWDVRFDLGRTRWIRHLLVRSLGSARLDRARDALVARIPSQRARLLELFARNRALAETILDVSRRSVLVDASKHPIRARFLARAGFDVRVVHLVRDPLGFAASCRKNQGMPLGAAVRLWLRGNRQALRLADEFEVLLLRYEDVCANPDRAVGAVATHVGVEPVALQPTQPVSHVIGNSMRLGFSGAIELDEQWRSLLSPDEVTRVLAETRALRERFGYEGDPSSSR